MSVLGDGRGVAATGSEQLQSASRLMLAAALALTLAGCGGGITRLGSGTPARAAVAPPTIVEVPSAIVENVNETIEAVTIAAVGPEDDSVIVDGWAPLTTAGDTAFRAGKSGGILKVGKPYQVAGRWYYPSHQPDYDQIGMASWYGDDFHGKRTANGETFRMAALTAAHPTLPLPSLVKVTNLDNGRSILVRVNDRGPYRGGRIIDLSKETARLLGFSGAGVAKVRVQYHGNAPLDGGDGAERKYLAAQSWYRPKVASANAESAVAAASASWQAETEKQSAVTGSIVAAADAVGGDQPVAGKFVVQVGSFRSEANARRVAQRLKSVGRIRITPEQRGGALIYIVTVGPFGANGDARDKLRSIVDLGISDAVVRRL